MGTENSIFYKLQKSGMCKYLIRKNQDDLEVPYIGCDKNNAYLREPCRLNGCEFQGMIFELAEKFNNMIKTAKKQTKGKN